MAFDKVNYKNLPKQQGYKIDLSKLDMDSYQLYSDDSVATPGVVRAFGGNEFHITYKQADPGHTIPWHLHSPTNYQVALPITGEFKWFYKDNSGNERSTTIGAGEMAYLPPGAYNKLEVVGDERHEAFVVERESGVPRIEHLIGDDENVYDPWEDPVWGLWLDTYRGKEWVVDENAVTRY